MQRAAVTYSGCEASALMMAVSLEITVKWQRLTREVA